MEGHKKTVKCLAQLNNGRLVSGSEDKTIKFWDVKFKKLCSTIEVGSVVYSLLVLAKNGKLCVGLNKQIKVLNCGDDDKNIIEYTLNAHHSSVNCMINNSLQDNSIITGGGKSIRIWDLNKKTCEYQLKGHYDQVMGLTILQDKQLVSCSADKTIKIWPIEDGKK